MKASKSLLVLFFTMFKIALFTFGGGYAMISFFENEFVNKKNYLTKEEFLDLIVIAESTPGPIAINCATYIGYKQNKLLGALLSTIAICLPSLLIIFFISIFFTQFMAISWVAKAFKGIQICVIFLILSAGFKLLKTINKNFISIIIILIVIVSMICLTLLSKNFASIFYILIGAILGFIIYCAQTIKNKEKEKNKEDKK